MISVVEVTFMRGSAPVGDVLRSVSTGPALHLPRGVRPASSLKFDEKRDRWFFKTLPRFVRRQKRHVPLHFQRKVNPDHNDGYNHQHQEQSTHRALHSSSFPVLVNHGPGLERY